MVLTSPLDSFAPSDSIVSWLTKTRWICVLSYKIAKPVKDISVKNVYKIAHACVNDLSYCRARGEHKIGRGWVNKQVIIDIPHSGKQRLIITTHFEMQSPNAIEIHLSRVLRIFFSSVMVYSRWISIPRATFFWRENVIICYKW